MALRVWLTWVVVCIIAGEVSRVIERWVDTLEYEDYRRASGTGQRIAWAERLRHFFWLHGSAELLLLVPAYLVGSLVALENRETWSLVLGWGIRIVLLYLVWVVTVAAFRSSATPRRTTVKAIGVLLMFACFAAFSAGFDGNLGPDCEPDPYFGQSCGGWHPVSTWDRVYFATRIAGFLSIAMVSGAVTGIRTRRSPQHRAVAESDAS